MTSVPIDDRAGLPRDELEELRVAIEAQPTLQAAVRWALARGLALVDVVDQDEFTRDVVFGWTDDTYLVYDAT